MQRECNESWTNCSRRWVVFCFRFVASSNGFCFHGKTVGEPSEETNFWGMSTRCLQGGCLAAVLQLTSVWLGRWKNQNVTDT